MAEFAPQADDKDRRSDHARDGGAQQPATGTSDASRAAAGAGADAAARGELSYWQRFRQSVGSAVDSISDWASGVASDAWDLLQESGRAEVFIQVNQAVRILRRLGIEAADLVVLDAAADSTNVVQLKIDILSGIKADVLAPRLDVAGLTLQNLESHHGLIIGLAVHWDGIGSGTNGSGSIARFELEDAVVTQQDQHIGVKKVVLEKLGFATKDTTAARFVGIECPAISIEGVAYPGLPPIDLRFANTSLIAALDKLTPAGQSGGEPIPGHGVLPEGSRIEVDVVGTVGSISTGESTVGHGSFAMGLIRLVRGSDELARVQITDFSGAGRTDATVQGEASIGQLTMTGEITLIELMLANPVVTARPEIQDALRIVNSVGLHPSAGVSVSVSNLTAGAGYGGQAMARGNFDVLVTVPQLGTFSLMITNLGFESAGGAATLDFDRLVAVLANPESKKELARLEMGGVHSRTVNGATSASNVPLLAKGDIAGLLAAAGKLDSPPKGLTAALAAIKGLGIRGDIEGQLDVNAAPGTMHLLGNFVAGFEVQGVGRVAIEVDKLEVDQATGGLAFDRFAAKLQTPRGNTAASFTVNGVGGTSQKDGKDFHARSIEATGRAEDLAKLLGGIEKHADALPANIHRAFGTIRALALKGGGKITAHDVTLLEMDGKASVGVVDVHGSFKLTNIGSVEVVLRGFDADYKAKNVNFDFDRFEATLSDATGKRAVHLAVARTSGGANLEKGSGRARVPSVQIDGDAQAVGTLVSSIRANLKSLPAPMADALATVEEYAPIAGGANASITATGLKVDRASGKLSGHADITARVTTSLGAVSAQLTGVKGDEQAVEFGALHVEIADAAGGSAPAAVLHAATGHIALDGKTGTIGALSASGDAVALHKLLTPEQRAVLPPMIGQILGMVDTAALGVMATDVSVDRTTGLSATGKANLSARIAHGTDAITATLMGLRGEGEQATFDALEVKVSDAADDRAGPVATLHVTGGRVRVDLTAGGLHGAHASGDGRRLQKLVDRSVQDLLPASIAAILAKTDQAAFAAQLNSLTFEGNGAGDTIHMAQFDITATVSYVDGATTYRTPAAQVTMRGAEVLLGADRKPLRATATSITLSGHAERVVAGDASRLTGNVRIDTGSALVLFNAGGIGFANANDVRITADGDLQQGPTTKPATPGEFDETTRTAVQTAGLVRDANLTAAVPLNAGRYGHGFVSANVLAGTRIDVDVGIADHSLARATAAIVPELDTPLGSGVRGGHLAIDDKGRGDLMADLSWGFNFELNALRGTEASLIALDIPTFDLNLDRFVTRVREIMKHQLDAKATAPSAAELAEQRSWLATEHAEWAEDAADNQRGKTGAELAAQRAEDAAEEPRSYDISDLATPGIGVNLEGVTGKLDANVDGLGKVQGAIHSGMRATLTAESLRAQLGPGTVAAQGMRSGVIDVDQGANGSASVSVRSFAFDQVSFTPTTKR